jgi:Zn2+/Cd2+-exporting ATPase
VVASPCALVLSIPSAILAAIAWGARNGILFRGGAAIEKLSEIDVVALDKTGTLTKGDLSVTGVESFPEGRSEEVLQLAFSLEMHSNHPLARAIVSHGKKQGLTASEVGEFQSFSGKGLRGRVADESIFLGRRELMESGPLAEWINKVEEPPPSVTEVWVFQKDLIGRILLEDNIRERSKETLARLKDLGIKTLMLTGDRRSAADAVGEKIGIQEIRSGLMPEDKVQVIKELTEQGKKVAMVGDGVNDAPSLAAAYVAVSMGARGSDAALEQSEVVLMNDKIEKFLTAFMLSRKAKAIIRQNLVISLGTVILMAGAALFGLIPLTVGVFAHEGSTVVVCLNSLRLLMVKE